MQKAYYLPEAHTDMIAAVIGEELGFVGIAGVTALFAIFGYAGFRIAQTAKDSYGKLLAAGLTALILAQAVINLFAVMGLAPLTGVPLPFVSYGNSSLLVSLLCGRPDPQRRPRAAPPRRRAARAKAAAARAGKLRVVDGGAQNSQESWWRRAEQPATSCPPWRSPTSFGLAAPRSASSGPGSGSRPSWSRPRATRSTSSRSRGIDRTQPAARRRGRRSRRSARGRHGAAAAAPAREADVVMGGGGFVAGPAGLAAPSPCGSRWS